MSQGVSPSDALRLGLGCSRLGSINGATGLEARNLLHVALDEGLRFFDTSNIYGQGDSERYLGNVVGNRADCIICSKGGKYLSLQKRLAVPLKSAARIASRNFDGVRDSVGQARSQPLPSFWDGPFLSRSIEASLKRLRRDRIDIYFLHSPPTLALTRGEAIATLEWARQAGKIGLIGVSVDDPCAMKAALDDPRVSVVQVPQRLGDSSYDDLILRAHRQGVPVIAREILGGAQGYSVCNRPSVSVTQRITDVLRQPEIALPLIGTTKIEHLKVAIHAARTFTGACVQ